MSNGNELTQLIKTAEQAKAIDLTPNPDKVKELSLTDQIMLQYNIARLKDLDPETQAQIKNITAEIAIDAQAGRVADSLSISKDTPVSSTKYYDFDKGILVPTSKCATKQNEIQKSILNDKKKEISETLKKPKDEPVSNRITEIYKDSESLRGSSIRHIILKIENIETDLQATGDGNAKINHAGKLNHLIKSIAEKQIWELDTTKFGNQIRLIQIKDPRRKQRGIRYSNRTVCFRI